ncbi:MAG: ribosomal L7Ae/L30e/S12e/Gadd45 family protein [Gemmatimonadota bacterium]
MSAEAPGDKKALEILGLARRAGRTVHGDKGVKQAARSSQLRLIVVARDASDNARARLPQALWSEVTVVQCGSVATLGKAIGRGRTAVLGVTDRELASKVVQVLDRQR